MSFSAITYNVLASAYIQRAWYRRTPALVLDPAWRVPALVQHVARHNADIIFLQEVEPETFVALRISLGQRGYGAQYARKQARRPDGVALLYRRAVFELLDARVVAYADGVGGSPDSGYIALIASLQCAAGKIGIINTHLTWDPPSTPPQAQVGRRQSQQLLAAFHDCMPTARGWIVAGDFNVAADSEIIALIERAGLRFAHEGMSGAYTCNVNGDARMIDYLFHTSELAAQAQPPTAIDAKTILPSAEEPSDHVALSCRFSWRD